MSPGPHTLEGSCHCQQIKFSAKGVGFEDLHKCNCAYCIKVGLCVSCLQRNCYHRQAKLHTFIRRFHVELERHSITLENGSVLKYDDATPPGYEGKLDFYLSRGEQSQARWYSCMKCHIFLFTTYPASSDAPDGCTVSLRCLNLAPSGKSMKDLTHRDAVRYDDMQSEVERNQHGEPFEGGEW